MRIRSFNSTVPEIPDQPGRGQTSKKVAAIINYPNITELRHFLEMKLLLQVY